MWKQVEGEWVILGRIRLKINVKDLCLGSLKENFLGDFLERTRRRGFVGLDVWWRGKSERL
jgi:hypothetical protein